MANKKIKILAIDDNRDNLVVLKALINDLFPEATYLSAVSGKNGIELCQSERPDVILLDIVMPGMDGYEVCTKLKADIRLKHIPVVMVTANRADKESRVKALEAGADAFLPKPVDESELKAQIKAMLRIKEAEDLKKAEKQRLEDMVLDRTEALELELADRKKAENKLIQSLDKITKNRQAIMNLMEDLKAEIAERKKMELSVQTERNLLRTLIDNLPDTIYVFDKECRKIIANKADVEVIGCESEADVLGKTDLEMFPGEKGRNFYNESMSVIKTGKPKIDFEEKFIKKNGEVKYLNSTQYPLYDINGQITGLVGIGHDITKRKKAEEDINAKNYELRFLNKLATDLAGLSSEENIGVFLNSRLKEFTGSEFLAYSEYDPDLKTFITRHIDASQKVIGKLINISSDKILNKPAPMNMSELSFNEMISEVVIEKKSLNEISFGAIPSFVDNAFGRFTGIDRYIGLSYVVGDNIYGTSLIGIKKDEENPSFELLKSYAHVVAVSLQRRRAEATLKISEENYRTLIQNQGEGVGIVDLDEKFVFVNPAAEEMFGVEKGALLNRYLTDFVETEQLLVIREETRKRSKAEKSTYELNIKRPTGEKRTILITATPQFTREGKLSGTFGVFRDITERKLNELELLRKQEFIETILENSPIGFAVNRIDDGSIIYVGSKFEDIYSVPSGSLNSVNEFFETVYLDPVQREIMRDRTINDIVSRDPERMNWNDIKIITRDGETKFVTAINIPLYEQNLMISTVQDVTARNISEKALNESYEFNNSLLSTIPFGMDIVDENGIVLFQSEKLHQIFGEKAIGSRCWELYRDDKKQCSDCPLFRGIKIGITENYESAGVLGGKVFDISHTGILFQGKMAMLEIFIDITERKKMEQKIIESEAYYRTLIDISPDGIVIADLEGNVSYGSIKALEIFGVPAGHKVIGSSVLNWIAPDFEQSIMERVTDIIKGNIAPETREYKLKKIDGTTFWGELSSSPLMNQDGIPYAIIIVCRDITDRKAAETELIKSKEKAEESDRLKTAFLHNISHEIRTPMNAIIGFSSLLREPDIDMESQSSYIETITQSSNHLLSIVNDIIEISNIEAGILKMNPKKTNPNNLMKSMLTQYMPKAVEKGIGLGLSVPDSDFYIDVDETKVLQVISNLLNNAFKFTSKGEIDFGYNLKKNKIEFFVSDTGIGISEEQHKRIFERFYQVENSISRQYEGTGLGLSISKAYVELLGGEIWLNSQSGKGTTFFFTIPFVNQETRFVPEIETIKTKNVKVKGKKTILIAEDEENNFRLMQAILSHLDLNIIHAENGKEAVEICRSGVKIDLVVMDIKMPVMDGYEATGIIKKILPSLPIIAQTAFAFESDRTKALNAGCDDYISKPVRKDLFVEMIMKYL